MRCLAGAQTGAKFPFIPGYSMVGQVVARGARSRIAEGTLVFCKGTEKAGWPVLWGAHIAHAVRGEDSVFVLPNGIDPMEAALTKLAAIAYRGVRCAGTRKGNEVAVVGLGIIGQLAARLHQLAGARVVAADLNPARVALAIAGGIEALVPAEGLSAAFKQIQPRGADIVVDSTGVPAVLQQSIELGKSKAWDDSMTEPTRLVVQGSFPENAVLNYDQAFAREISVHFPRDNQACDIEVILGLFAEGRLKARDLVSERCAPADAQRIYSELRALDGRTMLTAVFQWK